VSLTPDQQLQASLCRDFNCVFDMTVDELVSNPMMVNVFQRLRANGEDNGQEKVAAAVTELA